MNLIILIISAALFFALYIRSVSPARLEQKMGEVAYSRCKTYRIAASVFEGITVVNYIAYIFYPLPIGLPLLFPWEWWISVILGIIIIVPSFYIMLLGVKDAGEETLEPKKEHGLYTGIYEKVRHPQAIGESVIWFAIALFLNSPFLVLFSVIWLPIFYIMCLAEERDLIIRYGQSYLDYRDRVGFLIPKKSKN